MRALITGITGFAGSHLAEYILTKHPEVEIFGIMRWRSRTENIESIQDQVTLIECDLRDATSVKQLIGKVQPDKIFHLAAQSFVPSSWNAPAESLTTNIIGQLNIFEAVREVGVDPWIQIACSSEEYGLVLEDELPIVLVDNPSRDFYFPITGDDAATALRGLPEHDTEGITHLWLRRVGKSDYDTRELPFADKIIYDIQDINLLNKPNPKTDGLTPFVLNRLKHYRSQIEQAGHAIKFAVSRGPLNIATFLMGTTEFLMAIRINPEEAHKLLGVVTAAEHAFRARDAGRSFHDSGVTQSPMLLLWRASDHEQTPVERQPTSHRMS